MTALDPSSPAQELADLRAELALQLAALDTVAVGLIVVDDQLQVLVCDAAYETAVGVRPAQATDEALRAASVVIVRPDGTDWPDDDWPLVRALREVLDAMLMGVRRPSGTNWIVVAARPLHRDGDRSRTRRSPPSPTSSRGTATTGRACTPRRRCGTSSAASRPSCRHGRPPTSSTRTTRQRSSPPSSGSCAPARSRPAGTGCRPRTAGGCGSRR